LWLSIRFASGFTAQASHDGTSSFHTLTEGSLLAGDLLLDLSAKEILDFPALAD